MQIIPTIAAESQFIDILLGGQNCQIKVYQKSTGLYVDLYVDSALVIGGVIALDRNRIVRSAYLGFIGDLFFYDTLATRIEGGALSYQDPTFDGLGGQFLFCYLEATDNFNPGPM